VSNNKRGSSLRSYFDPATSQREAVSTFTMSPAILPLRAQLSRGDFRTLCFTGPSTATGRPRRVMVIR